MKAKLERINKRLLELSEAAHDEDIKDEIDDAILHVEAALDRLTQLLEEEDEEEEGYEESQNDRWDAEDWQRD